MKNKILMLTLLITLPGFSRADELIYTLKISNHLFYPDTLHVPSGERFKLIIENDDATAEEFESFELNREKVIMGNTRASIFIGPLKPDTYPFFGEFNPETAQGKIIAMPAPGN
jgi:hypothetical protein